MKIIISGVPCCGKTFLGDWLRDTYGFSHANLEVRRAQNHLVEPPHLTGAMPIWLSTLAENVVVTWGYPPVSQCIDLIRRFQTEGFSAWWFSADYQIARVRYVQREGEAAAKQFYDLQISRLIKADTDLKKLYDQNVVETLTIGGYKSPEEIFSIMKKDDV